MIYVFSDNVALGKPALQNANVNSRYYLAYLAVDSSLETYSGAASSQVNEPWLEVFLQGHYYVKSVIITNVRTHQGKYSNHKKMGITKMCLFRKAVTLVTHSK